MNIFITWAFNAILKWAYKLTPDHFAKAWRWVVAAEGQFQASTDKKAFVVDNLKKAIPGISNRAMNFLIEMAVAKLSNR